MAGPSSVDGSCYNDWIWVRFLGPTCCCLVLSRFTVGCSIFSTVPGVSCRICATRWLLWKKLDMWKLMWAFGVYWKQDRSKICITAPIITFGSLSYSQAAVMPREALYNWRAPHTAARSKCPAANPGKYGNDKKLFPQYSNYPTARQPLIILFKSLNMCNVQCVCTHRPMPSSSQSNSFTPSSPSALTAICFKKPLFRRPERPLNACHRKACTAKLRKMLVPLCRLGSIKWEAQDGKTILAQLSATFCNKWSCQKQVILKLPKWVDISWHLFLHLLRSMCSHRLLSTTWARSVKKLVFQLDSQAKWPSTYCLGNMW